MGIGIVGAYVWRAYANTQQRPAAVVMRELTFEGTDPPANLSAPAGD